MTPTLYEKASVPTTLASPKPGRDALIALVAALAISSAALFAARRAGLASAGRDRGRRSDRITDGPTAPVVA